MERSREARLRPEYAELYPVLPAGVWMSASDIGHQLLIWHLATARAPGDERVISEEHFEFRGGERRSEPWVNQRRDGQAPH
ncbi:MAG TPA: hypothetical protein VEB59_11110 [Gemmatimonadales bacterium]|nr:hypothetical protein [Gemmatimonadales bacterium]